MPLRGERARRGSRFRISHPSPHCRIAIFSHHRLGRSRPYLDQHRSCRRPPSRPRRRCDRVAQLRPNSLRARCRRRRLSIFVRRSSYELRRVARCGDVIGAGAERRDDRTGVETQPSYGQAQPGSCSPRHHHGQAICHRSWTSHSRRSRRPLHRSPVATSHLRLRTSARRRRAHRGLAVPCRWCRRDHPGCSPKFLSN